MNVLELIARRAMDEAQTVAFDDLNTSPVPDAPDGAPSWWPGDPTADAWLADT